MKKMKVWMIAALLVAGVFCALQVSNASSLQATTCACCQHEAHDGGNVNGRPMATCPSCNGSGYSNFRCTMCKGTGANSSGMKCMFCNGTGWAKCTSCNGTGRTPF